MAFGRTSENLCSLLLHQFLFCSEFGIRIYSRYEVPVPLQQARGHDANVQIGAEALCYGNIGQIRLFEDLAAYPGFLRKKAL